MAIDIVAHFWHIEKKGVNEAHPSHSASGKTK